MSSAFVHIEENWLATYWSYIASNLYFQGVFYPIMSFNTLIPWHNSDFSNAPSAAKFDKTSSRFIPIASRFASMCLLMRGHGPRFRRHCSEPAPSLIINISNKHSHTLTSVCPSPVVSGQWLSVCARDCETPNTCDRIPTKQKRGHHTRMYARKRANPSVCACVREGDADVRWQLTAGGHLEAAASGDGVQHICSKTHTHTHIIFTFM